MNGLINQTKLEGANSLGSLAIAFFGISAVLCVFATALTGGGMA